MKKFRVIRKHSGLKSGSREVSLIEDLKHPLYNPVQGKDVSHKALKLLISGLKSGLREIYLPQSSEALKSGSR